MQQDDLRWWHFTACQNLDLKFFFEEYENDPVVAQTIDGICSTCPVRALCREEGESNGESGVWGGVYLNNGKVDANRNSHKTSYIWEVVNEY